MDEQRFRARLAALDAATRTQHTNGDTTVFAARAFEDWLMRPAPLDADNPGANGYLDAGSVCNIETVADRLGYARCDTVWRTPSGALHRCRYSPDHEPCCVCPCGNKLEP